MEIRAFAEQVLFGDRLEDKLLDPGRLTDAAPGRAVQPPEAPARPDLLPMADGRPPSPPLPGPAALQHAPERARLLRRFAHHELQALELMALMLLRFVDADPALRRTLASTLRDEQRHLALYLARMQALGMLEVEPGSRFFWDHLKGVPTPQAFLAGMSLTLEQANLDFLTAWGGALRAVGDVESAELLREVYRDEIRHVRHGVSWMARLEPDRDLWTAWQAHLPSPLTPRRARGPRFDRQGRQRAGLPADVIERVRAAGASKGRTPRLFSFEPWFEASLRQPGFTPSKRLRALAADLAPTLAVLCGEDDVLLTPRPPSASFLGMLADRGWPLPEHRADERPGNQEPFAERIGWARTLDHPEYSPDTGLLARKDRVAAVLTALPDDVRLDRVGGVTCTRLAQVLAARAELGDSVVKLPLATAGRGVLRDPPHLDKLLRTHGAVVVEPWRQRVLDLSLQATVSDDGLRDLRVVRFLTRPDGGFRGVFVGAWRRGLPTELQRFLSGDGTDPRFVQRSLTAALRAALAEAPGHRGPIGLDAFVCRIDGRLRLRPLVEINPRLTFGRIGDAIGRRMLDRGRAGVWLHLTRRDLGVHESFSALARALPPPRGVPLRTGALPTTDPDTAEVVWTVLIAADTPAAALEVLATAQRSRPTSARDTPQPDTGMLPP